MFDVDWLSFYLGVCACMIGIAVVGTAAAVICIPLTGLYDIPPALTREEFKAGRRSGQSEDD